MAGGEFSGDDEEGKAQNTPSNIYLLCMTVGKVPMNVSKRAMPWWNK